ncbi:MAG: laccase domain-containing protein, partial [Selenomonadaceae bacterium]|nr:laccase domain-containing protein [Selenomonadaceae bacterium]
MSYYISQAQQNFWHGKFSSFPNEFVHAVSTRLSGVSQSPFDSLNLALHVGDQSPDVLTNRRYFAASLNLDARNIVTPNQVHGDHIVRVDDTCRGRGALSYDDSIKETDALIT